MDPNDYDSYLEAEQASMAAMMGFTSFGPASKKRKYNPRAEAVIGGGDDQQPHEASGTGANTLPLMPRQPKATGGGADEIDLDDDDEEDEEGQGKREKEKETARQPEQTVPVPAAASVPDLSLPSKPADVPNMALPSKPQYTYAQRTGGGGQQQEKRIWYKDYYDPSSNENPWEVIEKARGLEAKGPWLESGHVAGRERTRV